MELLFAGVYIIRKETLKSRLYIHTIWKNSVEQLLLLYVVSLSATRSSKTCSICVPLEILVICVAAIRKKTVYTASIHYCTSTSCNIMLLSAVDCGSPPPPGNNASPGTPTSTTYLGTVTYTCVSGYEVSIGVTIVTATCMANRTWGPIPTCQRM